MRIVLLIGLLFIWLLTIEPVQANYLINESFESALSGWEIISASNPNRIDFISDKFQIGAKALQLHYENSVSPIHLKKNFTASSNLIIKTYFYDSLQKTLGTIFEVKSSDGTKEIALGVNTASFANQYLFRADGVVGIVDSGVKRTIGWHLYEIVVTPIGSYAYIDGKIAGNSTGPYIHPTLTEAGSVNLISSWQLYGDAIYDGVIVNKVLAVDDFESGISGMTPVLVNAPNTISSINGPVFQGKRSIKFSHGDSVNRIHAKKSFTSSSKAVASIYYYDDMKTSLAYLIEAKNADESIATGLGVDTRVSNSNYIFRVNATEGNISTTIPRSLGWHQLEFRSNNGITPYIDGIAITRNGIEVKNSQQEISSIQIVSSWGVLGDAIFDNLFVAEPEISADQTGVWIDKVTSISRLDFVKDDIARLRWSPFNTLFPSQDYYLVPSEGTVAATASVSGDSVELKTNRAAIQQSLQTGINTVKDLQYNITVNEHSRLDRLSTASDAISDKNHTLIQKFNSPEGEYLYGFGNINDTMGIRGGSSITIAQENTKKRTPLWLSSRGYGILVNSNARGSFGWESNNTIYAYRSDFGKVFDYFILFGPEFDSIIKNYRTITGAAKLLPKSSFGYTQSKNRYTSQTEITQVANSFRSKSIPVDTLVIDYYWWLQEQMGSHIWNSSWPDPAGLMNALHAINIKTLISVWPSFQTGSANYNILNEKGYLFPKYGPWGRAIDQGNPFARADYWNQISTAIVSKGIDGIWLDASEPESQMTDWATPNAETSALGNTQYAGLIFPLLHSQSVFEGHKSVNSNKRVNTLSRGAVAGMQRYAIQSWSGDINIGINSLKSEIPGVLNFYSSGLPYFSTDTGGYETINPDLSHTYLNLGSTIDNETYVRWIQFSAFNSIMRSHGLHNLNSPGREPWNFLPNYQAPIIDAIKLRYRLLPYIYSLMGRTFKDGYTPVRPLVFDYRLDTQAQKISDQFLFGPSMIVCPVTVLGATSRQIYIPKGNFINFWTGENIQSDAQVSTISAPLTQIPILVKAGSIIPLGQNIQYATQNSDPLEIRIYPGAHGNFELYEDDGETNGYEQGQSSIIPFSWNEDTKTLNISKRIGTYPGMLTQRNFSIVLVKSGYGVGTDVTISPNKTVSYTGEPISVNFLPSTLTPTLPLATITSTPIPLREDIDKDGQVSSADLAIFISNFSKVFSGADFNSNGVLDILDYSRLIDSFGKK